MNHFCETFRSNIPVDLCVKRIDSRDYPLCLSCETGMDIASCYDRSTIIHVPKPLKQIKQNPYRPERKIEKMAAARGVIQSHKKKYTANTALKAQAKYISDLLEAEIKQLISIKARLDLVLDMEDAT